MQYMLDFGRVCVVGAFVMFALLYLYVYSVVNVTP